MGWVARVVLSAAMLCAVCVSCTEAQDRSADACERKTVEGQTRTLVAAAPTPDQATLLDLARESEFVHLDSAAMSFRELSGGGEILSVDGLASVCSDVGSIHRVSAAVSTPQANGAVEQRDNVVLVLSEQHLGLTSNGSQSSSASLRGQVRDGVVRIDGSLADEFASVTVEVAGRAFTAEPQDGWVHFAVRGTEVDVVDVALADASGVTVESLLLRRVGDTLVLDAPLDG